MRPVRSLASDATCRARSRCDRLCSICHRACLKIPRIKAPVRALRTLSSVASSEVMAA